MRQIKYRAWYEDIFDGTWKMADVRDIIWNNGYMVINVFSDSGSRLFDQPLNFKLMQFTGHIDNKGQEIFEGDIVVFTDGISEKTGIKYICEVVYGCGAFGISCTKGFSVDFGECNDNFISFWEILWNDNNPDGLLNASLEWIEVIGNSWESPELLEQPLY